MPWTPQEFQQKHAKHLSLEQAGHASSVAEAMLAGGSPEGEAIATGIARAEGRPKASPKQGLQSLVNKRRNE